MKDAAFISKFYIYALLKIEKNLEKSIDLNSTLHF